MTDELKLIKNDLRISHSHLDNLLQADIDACKDDLKRVGIKIADNDNLVNQLIRLYIRASQNHQNQSELYWQRYKEMRNAVSLNEEGIQR